MTYIGYLVSDTRQAAGDPGLDASALDGGTVLVWWISFTCILQEVFYIFYISKQTWIPGSPSILQSLSGVSFPPTLNLPAQGLLPFPQRLFPIQSRHLGFSFSSFFSSSFCTLSLFLFPLPFSLCGYSPGLNPASSGPAACFPAMTVMDSYPPGAISPNKPFFL